MQNLKHLEVVIKNPVLTGTDEMGFIVTEPGNNEIQFTVQLVQDLIFFVLKFETEKRN